MASRNSFAHTSNGRDWILEHQPGYAGAERYVDVPHAVADGSIVSAPGSASGTFAHRFLLTLYPAKEQQLAEMKAIFAREYACSLLTSCCQDGLCHTAANQREGRPRCKTA